ncbi:MAG TPA: Flp pilus assembly protein CpaB [Mycobacteriales bacterium]|nr:Flp pilus assembly protein CpaB [Mycobacteriales bacterium]
MSRRVLLIASTLLLAIVGTGAVLVYVGGANARAVAGKQAVTVLVAAKKVAAGTSAGDAQRDGLFRSEVVPAETVPADAVKEVGGDLAGLVATGDIQPGQLLLRPMFGAKQEQTNGLALTEGKIAVSIAVAGAQRVAGYVQPGSKVAVFDTFNVLEGQAAGGRTPAGDGLQKEHTYNQATRLLLPSVEVVAVGQQATTGDGSAKQSSGLAANGNSAGAADTVLVTVAVDQNQAEKLIHAAQTGAIYLALVTDSSTTSPGPGVDNRSVFGR